MNGDQLKRNLWKLGHFRNPEMPTDVIEDELDSLPLTSDAVKLAIRSYQDFMREDLDRLSEIEYGRLGVVDGEIGAVTSQLFAVPRCECADYPDDVAPAVGRGSWPSGCWEEYPNNHAFAVHLDLSRMPSFLNDVFDECIERCFAAYRDIGIAFFKTPDKNRSNTHVTFQPGRGWIGLAIVGQGQTCRTAPIWAKFDTRYRPSRLVDQWSRLLCHEFGHNMGLSHSRGGIMNPSISSGQFTKTAWRGDPSERILTRWFGGDPVPSRNPPADPDPDEPDPPNPPSGKLVFRGSVEAFVDGESVGDFILTPKPRV